MTARKKKGRAPERWFVYMLRCRDGSLYTGATTDVARRLREHNAGTASRYTRARLPVKLVYRETCADRSAALKREYAVKALPRAQKQALPAAGVLRSRRKYRAK